MYELPAFNNLTICGNLTKIAPNIIRYPNNLLITSLRQVESDGTTQ
jgi:hypothetical protein